MSEMPETTTSVEELSTDRRSFLSKAAIAAAVAGVAGVAASGTAEAANGDFMKLGDTLYVAQNTATATTRLVGGSTLDIVDGDSYPTAAGTVPASIVGRQTAANHVGVMGEATGTTGGWAVYGYSHGDTRGIGVYGKNTSSSGDGVLGEHASGAVTGIGVRGKSAGGVGVQGEGSTFDVAANGNGKVYLKSAGTLSATAAGAVGTIARDGNGDMWVCTASNSWRKIAGPSTAGAFHAVTPGRVYDSRFDGGPLTAGFNRTVSVANRYNIDTYALAQSNFVPANAKAITANVTIVALAGSGYVAANPGGTTTVTAATVNWSAAGQVLNNGVTLTLNASRQLTLICGGPGASTHVIIDVTGYYL